MSVEIKGLKELTRNLEKRSKTVIKAVDDALTEGAENIEGRAKLLAPVDRGLLRSSIVADTSAPLNKQVYDSAFYAPYLEFGTGKKYNGQRPEIARQFKGRANRGGYDDFIKNITEWVKRKGIASTYSVKTRKKTSSKASRANEEQAARIIAKHILRNGIKAANNGTGFFFRSYDEILPSILSDVRKALKEI